MATDKQSMLYHAPTMLNQPDIPWVVTVEGDSIVARWKWMDATFFAPHEINDQVKQYTFSVTLNDDGTWRELDTTEEKSRDIKVGGGKVGFGTSKDMFKGKKSQKSFQFGIGKDNQTDEIGFISFKFDTTQVKQHLRGFMEANGWKKAGLFG